MIWAIIVVAVVGLFSFCYALFLAFVGWVYKRDGVDAAERFFPICPFWFIRRIGAVSAEASRSAGESQTEGESEGESEVVEPSRALPRWLSGCWPFRKRK
ncbi:hypothetical protein Acsp06_14080 [Actinomycetospora sp. NBRC 106375]|uniref:hypothetical protein n=1 Tax=Actinomycetospora sp. NBRC 106375 TaxID=3032207 RepID=UPI0024A00DEE|nr:hypothetical protein [Actinomycetospora sp. NBRC 106375]GLZ45223.1 hypothetical protein Acsp06_14080 [Actinomycetospora sp. NBRC 106375]